MRIQMRLRNGAAIMTILPLVALGCATISHAKDSTEIGHGLVGLRPLPRTVADHKSNHGGSWAGTPTYAEQKGNYPFVAEHLDTLKGWIEGDFKTKRLFFE